MFFKVKSLEEKIHNFGIITTSTLSLFLLIFFFFFFLGGGQFSTYAMVRSVCELAGIAAL